MEPNKESYVANGRKKGHPLGHDAPHIPNKLESKELRKLKKKTGLTEEELLMNSEFRKKFSEAAKSNQKVNPDRARLLFNRKCRKISKLMGLPVYDPLVQEEAKKSSNGSYDF